MYEGIKKAISSIQIKIAPFKSGTGKVIKGKREQLERQMEHYSELYSKENILDSMPDTIDHLRIIKEMDTLSTVEELSRAKPLEGLLTGKALFG